MKLLTVIRSELVKMFAQRGTYAGYVLLAALIGLFVWGVWAEGPPMGSVRNRVSDSLVVGGNIVSAPLIAYLLLKIQATIAIFIPLLVSMIAGGIIAGEVNRETLRTVLSRPIHRWVLVIGKTVAAFIHAVSLVVFMGVLSLAVGYIVFGGGDIVTAGKGLHIYPEKEALLRLAAAYGAVSVLMCAVAAIAVFCSTIFMRPWVASGTTIGFLFVSGVLMVIPYFRWLKPYLITSHMQAFEHAFKNPIEWSAMWRDMAYAGGYAAAAIAATLITFQWKDIKC